MVGRANQSSAKTLPQSKIPTIDEMTTPMTRTEMRTKPWESRPLPLNLRKRAKRKATAARIRKTGSWEEKIQPAAILHATKPMVATTEPVTTGGMNLRSLPSTREKPMTASSAPPTRTAPHIAGKP